jgi:hypothetical protein
MRKNLGWTSIDAARKIRRVHNPQCNIEKLTTSGYILNMAKPKDPSERKKKFTPAIKRGEIFHE